MEQTALYHSKEDNCKSRMKNNWKLEYGKQEIIIDTIFS